jgi:hypothetical protein
MLLVFRDDGQLAATTAKDRLGPRFRDGDQFGHRLLVVGDDDFVTRLQVLHDLRQGRLSFWDRHGRHR